MYGRRKAKPIGFSNHDDPRRLVIRSEDSNPPPPEIVSVGIHYIVDLDNVEETDNDTLVRICDESLEKGEVIILNKMIHAFEPQGLTLLYLLSESHFSMHTWPEYKKIRIDFFSCETNQNKCDRVIENLRNEFPNTIFKSKILKR